MKKVNYLFILVFKNMNKEYQKGMLKISKTGT